MADISTVYVNATTYNIKDSEARNALSGKEDKSNKTTTIRSAQSASDTLYPTEKAVASAISTSTGAVWGSIAGTLADQTDLKNALDAKQGAISDLETIRGNAALGATAVQPSALNAYRTASAQDTIDSQKAAQTSVDAINAKIPSDASSSNQLVSAATMGDAIEAVEAKQLYKTNAQGSFATKAELTAATTFYGADGTVADPTKNDVAYVLADETHDDMPAKYVIANVSGSTITWGFVITFSNTAFTTAQMAAINSGATAAGISAAATHMSDSAIHVTTSDKTAWNSKVSDVTVGGTSAVSGNIAALGSLAGKSSATGSFTPAGSISNTPSTDTFNAVSSAGTLPSLTITVNSEVLSFSFSAGALPSLESVTALTGVTSTFSGTAGTVSVS